MNINQIGIAVVTFNRLDVLKLCLPSLVQTGCHVAVWDNGSDSETVDYLRQQSVKLVQSPVNRGAWFGRNRLIEYFRDHHPRIQYLLIVDSDVEIHPGSLAAMVEAMEADRKHCFVAWPQSNKHCEIFDGIMVEEVASECVLTRMDVWSEIGLFAEIDAETGAPISYYASDSYKFQTASICGYPVALVVGRGEGYRHYQHSSLAVMSKAAEQDAQVLVKKQNRIADYCSKHWKPGKREDPLPSDYPVKESYSQYGEDRIITRFFGNAVGRFLDLGSSDGYKDSNTLRLLELGWRGVCVEASPTLFNKMMIHHKRFLESGTVLHMLGLVAGYSGIRVLHLNQDGLSTTDAGTFSELHQRCCYYGFCHCPTVTPGAIAGFYGTDFDFVNIDLEGMDVDVARNAEYLLSRARLVCVERAQPGKTDDAGYERAWRELLGGMGFTREAGQTKGNLLLAKP